MPFSLKNWSNKKISRIKKIKEGFGWPKHSNSLHHMSYQQCLLVFFNSKNGGNMENTEFLNKFSRGSIRKRSNPIDLKLFMVASVMYLHIHCDFQSFLCIGKLSNRLFIFGSKKGYLGIFVFKISQKYPINLVVRD